MPVRDVCAFVDASYQSELTGPNAGETVADLTLMIQFNRYHGNRLLTFEKPRGDCTSSAFGKLGDGAFRSECRKNGVGEKTAVVNTVFYVEEIDTTWVQSVSYPTAKTAPHLKTVERQADALIFDSDPPA